jgi:multidrug efflux pump subunit AcrB
MLITVGATVFGLFPLAVDGGPLWEPLCYAQIGGLSIATIITLLLAPVHSPQGDPAASELEMELA